jgi:hypothetical protein
MTMSSQCKGRRCLQESFHSWSGNKWNFLLYLRRIFYHDIIFKYPVHSYLQARVVNGSYIWFTIIYAFQPMFSQLCMLSPHFLLNVITYCVCSVSSYYYSYYSSSSFFLPPKVYPTHFSATTERKSMKLHRNIKHYE